MLVLGLMAWLLFWPKPEIATIGLPAPRTIEATDHLLNSMTMPGGQTVILELDRDALIAAMPKQLIAPTRVPRTKPSENWEGYASR